MLHDISGPNYARAGLLLAVGVNGDGSHIVAVRSAMNNISYDDARRFMARYGEPPGGECEASYSLYWLTPYMPQRRQLLGYTTRWLTLNELMSGRYHSPERRESFQYHERQELTPYTQS